MDTNTSTNTTHMQMGGMDGPYLWSDMAAWSDTHMHSGGDVVISEGVHVILDTDTAKLGNLVVHGKLEFGQIDATITADNVIVFGELAAGSADVPHAFDAHIVLTGVAADPDVVMSDWAPHESHGHHHDMEMDGGHAHTDAINNKALLVAPGGKLSLHGAEKTSWTQLDNSVTEGAQTIDVLDATGWTVGDTLAIAPTGFDPHEVEERYIVEIDGNTITLDTPLTYDHFGAVQDLGDGQTLDMRAEVANLSRNIKIEGADEGERDTVTDERGNAFEVGYGGHTMYHEGSAIEISGVEFFGLGITGEKGNYPVHFHKAGDMEGSYVEDSVIHHSMQRGMIVHQTDNLNIEGNVIFDTVGHQFYLEDGNEEGNVFAGNLGMLPRPTPKDLQIETLGPLESSVGERASVFWITNQGNDFIGNHAVGIEYAPRRNQVGKRSGLERREHWLLAWSRHRYPDRSHIGRRWTSLLHLSRQRRIGPDCRH